jgi:adenine-specific DNA-methyltransferase
MKRLSTDSPELKSADLVAENIERLKSLLPEAFANEGKIDFDVLRQLFGDRVDDGEERYGLNWHGKRAARQLALTASTGTLRPCPEESVDWDTTQNIFIEGDNLEVLKLLQKSYAGKVKLIYIDPPYNTGKDFVYPDNFQDSISNYLEITGQVEGGQLIASNTEADGRFHTDWLNMMYPRLKLAKQLLAADGFLAVSISDNEVPHLRLLLDDLFGESNLVESFVWESIFRPSNMSRRTRRNAEYVLLYAKDGSRDFELVERLEDPQGDASLTQNNNAPRTLRFPAGAVTITLPDGIYSSGKKGDIDVHDDIVVKDGRNTKDFRITGKFKWSQEYLDAEIAKGVALSIKSEALIPYYRKVYKQTALRPTKIIPNDLVGDVLSANAELRALFGEEVFSYPKPTALISFFMQSIGLVSGDIVCDFFAGSGTTAHAAYAHNVQQDKHVRFVLIQLPEPLSTSVAEQQAACAVCDALSRPHSIAEITKQRLRLSGAALRAELPLASTDLGFRVFKLDAGNIRPWEASKETLSKSLAAAVDHVKADRTEDDLLYDIILKHGLDLCAAVEKKRIGGHNVRSVGGGAVFACFASRITAADVEQLADGIAKWRDELAPANPELSRVVFRDSSFETDVAKTNLALILKERGFDEKLVVSL